MHQPKAGWRPARRQGEGDPERQEDPTDQDVSLSVNNASHNDTYIPIFGYMDRRSR